MNGESSLFSGSQVSVFLYLSCILIAFPCSSSIETVLMLFMASYIQRAFNATMIMRQLMPDI